MPNILASDRYLNPLQNVQQESRHLGLSPKTKMADIKPLLGNNEIPVIIGDRGFFKFASFEQRDHNDFINQYSEGALLSLEVVALDVSKVDWSASSNPLNSDMAA